MLYTVFLLVISSIEVIAVQPKTIINTNRCVVDIDQNPNTKPIIDNTRMTAVKFALFLILRFNFWLYPSLESPKNQNANPRQMATMWALETDVLENSISIGIAVKANPNPNKANSIDNSLSLSNFPYESPNIKSNIPTTANPIRLNQSALGSPFAPSLLIKSSQKLKPEFDTPKISSAVIKVSTDRRPKIPIFFSVNFIFCL